MYTVYKSNCDLNQSWDKHLKIVLYMLLSSEKQSVLVIIIKKQYYWGQMAHTLSFWCCFKYIPDSVWLSDAAVIVSLSDGILAFCLDMSSSITDQLDSLRTHTSSLTVVKLTPHTSACHWELLTSCDTFILSFSGRDYTGLIFILYMLMTEQWTPMAPNGFICNTHYTAKVEGRHYKVDLCVLTSNGACDMLKYSHIVYIFWAKALALLSLGSGLMSFPDPVPHSALFILSCSIKTNNDANMDKSLGLMRFVKEASYTLHKCTIFWSKYSKIRDYIYIYVLCVCVCVCGCGVCVCVWVCVCVCVCVCVVCVCVINSCNSTAELNQSFSRQHHPSHRIRYHSNMAIWCPRSIYYYN